MTCPKCCGTRILTEWVVDRKIGDCFVVIRKHFACWKCKGTGQIRG
jgi:hypothetical protein